MKTPYKSDAGTKDGAPAKLPAFLARAMALLAVYQRGRDPVLYDTPANAGASPRVSRRSACLHVWRAK